jgi:acetate kinase
LKVLALNVGSSSLKAALVESQISQVLLRVRRELGPEELVGILDQLFEDSRLHGLAAVGHRVVYGGDRSTSALLDEPTIRALEASISLDPLHAPMIMRAIHRIRERFPELPQVAVFDTAFHRSLPPEAAVYALPPELGYRRYGFHGISHHFVALRAAEHLGVPLASLRLVSLHLGSGASAAAIGAGLSQETSMGYTPLEGLVMGTRPGDLDPGIVLDLVRRFGLERAEEIVQQKSGLKALAGTSDFRELWARREEPQVNLALKVYVHRILKYVGAYAAVLGGLDALIFTGGIGEHVPWVREQVLLKLSFLGFRLDPEANLQGGPQITFGKNPIALVLSTDEELAVALETARLIER